MDDDEAVAMRTAGDIARHRRTDDVRRRTIRVATEDACVQTVSDGADSTDWMTQAFSRMRKQTTVLCYLALALVITNVSQLRFVLSAGEKHRHYLAILGLLSLSLFVQCNIAFVLLYVARKETTKSDIEGYPLSIRTCNCLVLLLVVVCAMNVVVFLLA